MRRREDFDPNEERDAEGRTWDESQPSTSTSGVRPRTILIGLLAIALIVFAVANFKPVDVNFLVFESRARVITVIAVAGALGFGLGYLVGRPTREERRFLRRRED